MDKSQEILDRIIDIEKSIEFVEDKFTIKHMFFIGMVKGVGALIGAILLIIIGGWFLRAIGVIPAFEDFSLMILEAADKARLR